MLILAMDTLSDRVPRLSHRLRGTCLCNVTHVSWSESVRECVTQAVCVSMRVCAVTLHVPATPNHSLKDKGN